MAEFVKSLLECEASSCNTNTKRNSTATSSSDSQVNADTEFLVKSWSDGINEYIFQIPKVNGIRDIVINVMPGIKMQPYNGEPEKWHDFITNFEILVHNNTMMTNAQKHAWLRQLLTPVVRYRIDKYSDYDQALETLKERYGNPNIILRVHNRAILSFEKVKEGDIAALENLLKTVTEALQFYQTNGFENEIKALSTLIFVSEKLPNKLLGDWNKKCYCTNSRLNLEDFVKWLEERVWIENYLRDMKIGNQQTAKPRGNSRKRN